MSRNHSDWIEGYLEYTAEHESPEKIHFWTAVAILSAATKRQVFMERVFYNLYPNVYILIVAESARARKSVAMDIGLRLLKKSDNGVFLMRGRMTPEGLIFNLNRSTVTNNPGGKGGTVFVDSHVFVVADELATLFGYDRVTASRMAILLTETYGCPDYYPHTTAGEGVKELYNLYPTILAATDPRNLKVLPEEAIAGLLGRLIFVSAAGTRKAAAWMKDGQRERAAVLQEKLIHDLLHISSLKGEMHPTQEAKDLFEKWYDKIRDTKVDDPRVDPFIARCHDTAIKIAMLMSVAHNDTLIVSADEMAAAIAIIENQLPESIRIVQWTGASQFAQARVKFLDTLKGRGNYATRRDMLRIMELPVSEFDSLESTMLQEERITRTSIPRLGIVYKLRDDKEGPKDGGHD